MSGFEAKDVWSAHGRGFQMGYVEPEGKVVHLTGQVAWSADEEIIGHGDITLQTRQCFENISRLLQVVGGELGDIVSVTTYYTDPYQLPFIQQVRKEVFTEGCEPTSTSVMVAGLGHADFLVELTPIAVIPLTRFKLPK